MKTESITWHDAANGFPNPDDAPDFDEVLLIEVERTDDGSTELFVGYWSKDMHWIDISDGEFIDWMPGICVIAWALAPAGSRAC